MPFFEVVRKVSPRRETRSGYDPDAFPHWISHDGPCANTRAGVLDTESRVKIANCDLASGKWRSFCDHVVTTDSFSFDIDHMVPLAEAWDSGARKWSTATRQRFANDLRDPRSLLAVTASSNRSKGDRDPHDWLPI